MAVKIQFRRDQSANWAAANPTLAEGELGLELDGGKFKVGNGVAAWNDLPYSSGPAGESFAALDGGGPSTNYTGIPNIDGGGI
jgi:Major tropism determinant N-terminal domain